MKIIKTIILLLAILLFFSLFSCFPQASTPSTKSVVEATTTTTQTATTDSLATTTIAKGLWDEENPDNQNKDVDLFFKAIEEYNIISKDVDYSSIAFEIQLDYLEDIETNTFKMSKEDVGNRYMELAIQVGKDFMVISIVGENILEDTDITEVTPEMKQMIELIETWADKKKTQFEYTAKYYYGDGEIYDIEAKKLEDEANKASEEFIDLQENMRK